MRPNQVEFIECANRMFPGESVLSRKQLIEVEKECGRSYGFVVVNKSNRVSNGMYALPSMHLAVNNASPVKVSMPKQPKAKVTAPVVENIIHTERRVASNTFDTNVPQKNKNYVKFGHYADLKRIIDSNMFYPVFITGQSGNGKTAMVEQICAELKREMYRVNFTPLTDESDLLGDKTLVDGNVIFEEGVVITAAKRGAILLLDEVDYATAQGFTALQSILEGKPFLNKKTGEMVYPVPGFNVIATANTKGKGSEDGRYIGTNVLNEAFLERFAITFNQEYPSAAIERKIVMNLMESYSCKDEDFADTLVKWADAIRRTFADGGVDETITTRRLVHIVRAFSIFKDKKKAVELCINRFDDITRNAFADLFEKVATPAPVVSTAPQSSTEIPF